LGGKDGREGALNGCFSLKWSMRALPFHAASELKIANPGLACDIDESLSFTAFSWMVHSIRLFGNPEGMSPQELVDKYHFSFNVPYWISRPDFWDKVGPIIYENDFQRELPVMPGAVDAIKRIQSSMGIACYATARPIAVEAGTRDWLQSHGFPNVDILMRPQEVGFKEGDLEKVRAVVSLYPTITGLIDDKAAVVNYFPADYKGTIYHLGTEKPVRTDIKVIPCKDWCTLAQEVSRARNVSIDP
jgi:hypothetical protein